MNKPGHNPQLIFTTHGTKGAIISPCENYRYALWRRWNLKQHNDMVCFIGLNPSKADAYKDDHTIKKLMGFASRWGYGGIIVANLFAWRDTEPKHMMTQPEPVGWDNDEFILSCILRSRAVIPMWGAHGIHQNRCRSVFPLLAESDVVPMCFGLTQLEQPKHPARLGWNTTMVGFAPSWANGLEPRVRVGDIFGAGWPRQLVAGCNANENWFSFAYIKQDGTVDKRHEGTSGGSGCCRGPRDRPATAAIAYERIIRAGRGYGITLDENSLVFNQLGADGEKHRITWKAL